jgi:hypothetical protein
VKEVVDKRRPPAWAEVSRESAKAAAWVAAALLAVGVPAGLLGAALAPRMVWVRQGGGGYFRDSNSEALVAADDWFFLMGIAVGVVAGLIVCRLVRRHGPLLAIALAVGSLGGSYLAAVLGHWVTLPEFSSTAFLTADGKPMDYFLTVRASATIFAWPFAAEMALLLFTLLRWPREVPEPEPAIVGTAGLDGTGWPGDVHPPPVWTDQPPMCTIA